MEPILRVVMPVRRVLARFDKKSSQFVPCESSDARGTLLVEVDQAGRSVMGVHGVHGEVGYQLTPGQPHDAALFAAWIKAHPKITEEERR